MAREKSWGNQDRKMIKESEYKKSNIDEKCKGCSRQVETVCSIYISPAKKWRSKNCPMATHISLVEEEPKVRKRVGQQKQVKNKK